jgi:hypothetical protein
MVSAAKTSGPRARRVGLAGAAAVFALAALPAAASAASIAPGPAAPVNNAAVKFNGTTTAVPIDYTADLAGCANPSVTVALAGPRPQPAVAPVAAAGSGSITVNFTRPNARLERHTWNLVLACEGQQPVGSEKRAIRLIGPPAHARLEGRHVLDMRIGKTRRRFTKPTRLTFLPRCKRGVCATRDNFKDLWRYNKRTKRYKMRTRFNSSCTGRRGVRVRGGATESFTFSLRVRRTLILKGQRFVRTMVGSWVYVQRPNARGRAAGCGLVRVRGVATSKLRSRIIV